MREKYIKNLIRLVEESDIDILEISRWGTKVKITRRTEGSASGNGGNPAVHYSVKPQQVETPPASQVAPPEAPVAEIPEEESKYITIKSPMVGTFYAAPAPDAKPYTGVGQYVDQGQVVCIVEAMKLMNEIESEVAGRVVKVCVENTRPVEFGQALYLIDPSG